MDLKIKFNILWKEASLVSKYNVMNNITRNKRKIFTQKMEGC